MVETETKMIDIKMKAKMIDERFLKEVEEVPSLGNVLLDDMSEMFAKCLETAIRKNHDYGGTNKDPYNNFRNSTIAGVSVEKGILVRLMDKMSRISTLLDKDGMVEDETVIDTIEDAINYYAILGSYLKNKKNDVR